MPADRMLSNEPSAPALAPADRARYGRHLSLPGFGETGQQRLLAGRVAVIGMGGLGCPAAMYLAAAGVGVIGLIDGDRVDASNLHRQVLYGDADVGRLKVEVAAERLRAMNGSISIQAHPVRLQSENALAELSGYDVIVDGTDNFPARYLVNDAAVLLGIPVVHGSVLRYEGRVMVLATAGAPCYRCLYPEPPPAGAVPDCNDAGVLGVLPGLVGVLQATEVIKLLSATGGGLAGRLLLIDALGTRFQTVTVPRSPSCPMCGTREITSLIDYDAFCGHSGGDEVVRLAPSDAAGRLSSGVQVVDVREPWEWAICRLPGAILVPLAELPGRLGDLDASREIMVYCHRGSRSLEAARLLRRAGFARVSHVEGGIDRYSAEVDAGVPRY